MHLADRELGAGTVAYVAALSQRIGWCEEVSRGVLRNVAPAAGRARCLYGVDPPLRVGHLIQADRQVLLATVDVAHGAVSQIGGASLRAHGRVEHTGEVVDSPPMAH